MRRLGTPETPKSWRSLVRWPAFLLANVALLCIIGVSTVRETYRGWTADREINALEAQAAALEGNKLELEALAKDLVSSDRIEYEARARLGMKKPGERVIVLEGFSTSATWSAGQAGTPAADEDAAAPMPTSNPERWWAYFFSKKSI